MGRKTAPLKSRSQNATTFHRDGTITYWSVYMQVWVRRASADSIVRDDLAALPERERMRIVALQLWV